MTSGDEVLKLRGLHEEFLNEKYFSAFSIITPKRDWLCVDKNESNIDLKIEKAKRKKIFNLVVKENERISGSINLKYLERRQWDKLEEIEKFSVLESMHLFDLVERMVKDSKKAKRELSPLYFVYPTEDRTKDPVGIVTFWDLNRAPSYILSYPILVYLEHTLLFKIRDSHKEWSKHTDLLNKLSENEDPYHYIKKFVKGPQYDYKVLSRWWLPQLVYFYKNDQHIERNHSEIPEELISSFIERGKFRNRLGHTVNLIIRDDKHFNEDLNELNNIWNLGKKIFINFIDPKVRHSSPV